MTALYVYNEAKKNLESKYQHLKNVYKSNDVVYNITESSVDKLYEETIKNLSKEFDKYNNNKDKYDIFKSANIKDAQFMRQVKHINEIFYKNTLQVDPLYIITLEEEFLYNKKKKQLQEMENKANKDFMRMKGAVALVDTRGGLADIIKKTAGS
jgi:hypothetical protein